MFEAISNAIKNTSGSVATGASSLFGAVGKYFEPAPNETRVRDVVKAIPEGFSKVVGQPSLRGYGALSSLITGKPLTPSTPFQKNLYGTDKPLTFTGVGEEIGVKNKYLAPVVGFGLTAGDLLPGGQARRQAVEQTLESVGKAKGFTGLLIDTGRKIKNSKIWNITTDSLIGQDRAGYSDLDLDRVKFYRDKIKAGEKIEPLKVDVMDGNILVEDGKHRLAALREEGIDTVDVIDATKKAKAPQNVLDLRERGVTRSLGQSPAVDPVIKARIDGRLYKTIANETSFRQADDIVNNDIAGAWRLIENSNEPSALRSATGLRLIEKLQQDAQALRAVDLAQSNKLYDDAVRVIDRLAESATKAGQEIQIYAAINKLSPEGITRFAANQLQKANKILTPELQDTLIKTSRKIQELPEGRDKVVETAKMMKLISDQIPANVLKKISTMQTIAQLLNPKTIVRNIIGNLGFALTEIPSQAFAAAIDTLKTATTGRPRSVAAPSLSVMGRGFIKGFKEGAQEAKQGINTLQIGTQFDVPKTEVFKGRVGRSLQRLMDIALRAPDRAFFQAAYDDSLYGQMKLAGVKVPTEEMKEIATLDGLYRTFQDDNLATNAFQGIKKALNLGKDFGLGDLLIKYPKTPANLLNRGLAYTPAGFIKTALELGRLISKSPNASEKKLLEAFGRASVGSAGLFGTGALMHKLGLITTEAEEDADIRNVQQGVGLGQYKMNISGLKRFVLGGFDPKLAKIQDGDRLISYDWFQPNALSIVLGADFDKGKGNAGTMLSKLISGITQASETLTEQPLLRGITDAFKYADSPAQAFVDTLSKMPASFVPTFLNQVRQLTDNTARSTYDEDKVQYSINLVKSRIPGLASTLEPTITNFGEEQEIYQNGGNNLFNVLFNPSFVTKYDPTPEAKLVLDLWKETGEVNMAPRKLQKKQKVNGKERQLTPEEYTKMQRFTGTITRQYFNKLAQNEKFRNAPEDEQIAAMGKVLTAVGSAAKIHILGDKPKKPSTLALSIVQRVRSNLEEN